MTHKLLQRQLKRLLGVVGDEQLASLLAELQTLSNQPEISANAKRALLEFGGFLGQVNEAYVQSERDLDLSTRSLELSSDELGRANDKLRGEAASRERALKTLRDTTNQLLEPLGQHIGEDDQSLGRLTQLLSGLVHDFLQTRKDAQAAYTQLEQQQFALNEHAIVSIADAHGHILYANDKFCEISKMRREDLLGQDHRIVNSGVHSREFFTQMWDTISAGKVWHGEVCNRATDSGLYWVAATIVPFLDEHGLPYQYISMRTDISAQKKLEAEIASRGRMLENIMDTLGEGLYLLDQNGICTYVNREAESLLGWSLQELQGTVLHDVIHARRADGTPLARNECLMHLSTSAHQVYRSEDEVFVRKDGSSFPIAIVAAPILDGDTLTGSVAAFQDISKRKRTEEELRQSDIKQRMLIDNAADAVLITDQDGDMIYVNELAVELLGYARAELVGVSLFSLFPPEFLVQFDRSLRHTLHDTGRLHWEVEFGHKLGHKIPLELNAAILPDRNVYISCRDIKTRKEVEATLLRAKEAAEATSKAKSDFLATMSHEIRTPMNGIIGMTELALDTDLDAEQREYIGLVKTSADSLLTIINDILDFSKIESGKMHLEQVEFDLRALIASATKLLAVKAEQKGLELICEIADEVPRVLIGDPGRLRQVLTNLIGNAIKFAEHGNIDVRVRLVKSREQEVVLSIEVADQGIGIAPEKQASIFEAFTQADTSTTRKYGGTGLGLAISSQLVAAMGGKLGVKSELGQGSTFRFEVTFTRGTSQLQPTASVALQGVTVLIVDDNATNLRLLSQLLLKWGMKPTLANGAAQARAVAAQAHQSGADFTLVILDAMMPDEDGFALAQSFRDGPEMSSAIMMMLSSAGMRGDAQRCRDLGILAYLTKPIDQSELLNAIQIALGAPPDSVLITRHNLKEARHQKQLNILLAEDNPVNQKLAVTLLAKWGHAVDLAETGVQALSMSASGHYDLILMDLQMPEMGGLEATRLIRERERGSGRQVPIVAMTANAMFEDRERCLAVGMNDHIAKPLNNKRLHDVLAALIPAGVLPASEALAPGTVPAPPSIAFDYAGALATADDWVIEAIGQAFLDDCPQQMQDMLAAITAADRKTLARLAHTLRGLVGNFNARRIEELARGLEHFDPALELSAAHAVYAELALEMEAFKAALQRKLNPPSSPQ